MIKPHVTVILTDSFVPPVSGGGCARFVVHSSAQAGVRSAMPHADPIWADLVACLATIDLEDALRADQQAIGRDPGPVHPGAYEVWGHAYATKLCETSIELPLYFTQRHT